MYFELSSLDSYGVTLISSGHDPFPTLGICVECKYPEKGRGAIDVDAKQELEPVPFSWVFGTRMASMRSDFIDDVGRSQLAAEGYFGKVTYLGQPTPYETYYSRWHVNTRGDKRSTFRICSICGRGSSFAMGKKYLVAPLPSESLIYCEGDLLLPEPVFARMKKWPKVAVTKIPIRAKSSDGHPDELLAPECYDLER